MKLRLAILLSMIIFIVGCSNNAADQEESREKEEIDTEESVKNEEPKTKIEEKIQFPEISSNGEEIVNQNPGELVDEAISINENGNDEDWEQLLTDIDLRNLDNNEAMNGLVYYFGLDYSNVYNDFANFEPDYSQFGINGAEESKKQNITIHLDSSGSMNGQVSGGVKMDLAKKAITNFAAGLNEDSLVSLRVYGHEGTGNESDKTLSCSSTELMYEPNTYEAESFSNSLNQFKASGWTPLASSIKAAYADLQSKASEDTENILFIVSDGIETCGGNPVKEAEQLAGSDLDVEVNIIGFDINDEGQKQLKETAQAGNGTFYTVNSDLELNNTINELLNNARKGYQENFQKAQVGIDVNTHSLNEGKKIRGLSSSFIDAATEESQILKAAISQMSELEKIEEEQAESLRETVDERYEALMTLKDQLYEEAYARNDQKREEAFNKMRES